MSPLLKNEYLEDLRPKYNGPLSAQGPQVARNAGVFLPQAEDNHSYLQDPLPYSLKKGVVERISLSLPVNCSQA